MSTRKYRYDPETGGLAPISVTHSDVIELPPPPLSMRALRLLLIVGALAVSATVFSMVARGEEGPPADARP